MSYSDHHNFFARAYRTGTDYWTSIPFSRRAHELTLYLPKGALLLDLGTGRGRLLFDLEELGFRAIGLEYDGAMVKRLNNEIKERGLEHSLRAMQGDTLDIPLSDQSFDAAVDVGLLQHILPKDYKTYVAEAVRVLKQGGFFFLVLLSSKTSKHLGWHPSQGDIADYQLEGVNYHFFGDRELRELFEKDFEIKYIDHDMPNGPMGTIYAVVLLRKK